MLKHRIEKIERKLGKWEVDKEKVDAIHTFFVSGNENLIPDEVNPREVYKAAILTKEKGASQCPGLQRMFQGLRRVKLVGNEQNLFDFLRTNTSARIVALFTQNLEEDRKLLSCSKKLGLIDSLRIFIMPRPYDENRQK